MRSLVISLFILIASSLPIGAETITVVTKQNAIRQDCKFFSHVKKIVNYNDALEVVSQEGDWYQVKFGTTQGCIHKSAVEKKSFSLTKLVGSDKESTSGEEVALAGKGFNPQVEAAYKRQNPELNFGAVDKIEGYKVSESALIKFIESGKLNLQ